MWLTKCEVNFGVIAVLLLALCNMTTNHLTNCVGVDLICESYVYIETIILMYVYYLFILNSVFKLLY